MLAVAPSPSNAWRECPNMNLNQITLPSLDIAASTAFYRAMGFTQIVGAPHYARFECPDGDSTFSVHLVSRAPGETNVVVYFEVEDVDARVRELKAKGFEFLGPPSDESWLWREARLKDPSGNILCLYRAGKNRKNPAWRLASG
jgi:predicted enzyme related to lactoylglutathione lyase